MGFVSKAEIKELVSKLGKSSDANYITVYRVESYHNGRFDIGSNGDVSLIDSETTLFLNFGVKDRAVEYALGKVLNGTEGVRVVAFDIEKTFFQNMSSIAKNRT